MHEYTIKRPLKIRILFLIAFLSITFSQFINQIVPIAASALFILLWLLFSKVLWNKAFMTKISQTPDLNGTWDCDGEGKKQNNPSITNPWKATITIEQNFSEISIYMKTKNNSSQSISCGASIEFINKNTCRLSYPYKNTPLNADSDMYEHDGFCQLTFNLENKTATGYYYTNNSRKSYGFMNLSQN
jgi:hypothetical protein